MKIDDCYLTDDPVTPVCANGAFEFATDEMNNTLAMAIHLHQSRHLPMDREVMELIDIIRAYDAKLYDLSEHATWDE